MTAEGPKGTWGMLTFWVLGVTCTGGSVERQKTAFKLASLTCDTCVTYLHGTCVMTSSFGFMVLVAFSFVLVCFVVSVLLFWF